jgi:hypothetical protein
MKAQLFAVKYPDKHAAALIYKKLREMGDDLGILACGLEKYKTKSKRIRNRFKLILAVDKERAQNLPGLLKIAQNHLREHKLFNYISFDFCITPISKTEWNFDSYDDPNYQNILIRKRS